MGQDMPGQLSVGRIIARLAFDFTFLVTHQRKGLRIAVIPNSRLILFSSAVIPARCARTCGDNVSGTCWLPRQAAQSGVQFHFDRPKAGLIPQIIGTENVNLAMSLSASLRTSKLGFLGDGKFDTYPCRAGRRSLQRSNTRGAHTPSRVVKPICLFKLAGGGPSFGALDCRLSTSYSDQKHET